MRPATTTRSWRGRVGDGGRRLDCCDGGGHGGLRCPGGRRACSRAVRPSEADDAARARWAKAFVDAGCPSAHHAAALVASNAGDRRYGEVGFWTSALILRAARAPSTARIADLGSGVGRFTLAAALLMPEAQVVGVEIAPELHAVAMARRAESQPQVGQSRRRRVLVVRRPLL